MLWRHLPVPRTAPSPAARGNPVGMLTYPETRHPTPCLPRWTSARLHQSSRWTCQTPYPVRLVPSQRDSEPLGHHSRHSL